MDNISLKKATLINFISRYSNIFMQLVLNSILARILTPDDYGIVAVITVFISFFTILADMGIGPAIIQHKELEQDEINDIYSFTFYTSICVAGGFVLFSIPLSVFYNNHIYIRLGIMLSISILFSVLNIVPNSLLIRDKQFKLLGVRTVFVTIISGSITILLALLGAKYYALVTNSIIISTITFILNRRGMILKFKLKINMKSVNKIKEFSLYQFGFNFINYFSRNLDNLLIGKFIGQNQLGYYDKAYKLMLYPVQNLSYVINPILHPVLAEHKDMRKVIYEKYIKVIKILSLLAVYFMVFSFFCADDIIIVMFGKQWISSASAFKLLSLTIWVQVITSTSGAIFQATGETKRLFMCGTITTIINIIGIIIGVLYSSIETVAFAILISFTINFVITFYLLINKVLNQSLFSFIRSFKTSFIIFIILLITMVGIGQIIDIDNPILDIVIKLPIYSFAYIIGIIITGEYKFLKTSLFNRKESVKLI